MMRIQNNLRKIKLYKQVEIIELTTSPNFINAKSTSKTKHYSS